LTNIVFLLMSSYKFYVTEDSMVHNHRESDSRTKGILKQSLLPTTIYPSPGGITLVLPFFLLFQIPRNPFVYPRDRRSHAGYIVESHNTPKTRLASGRKPRPLFPASFSCRKKKLFPKYDDPETVSPHFLNFAVRKHLPAEQFVDR
jgi:hypothetical protein